MSCLRVQWPLSFVLLLHGVAVGQQAPAKQGIDHTSPMPLGAEIAPQRKAGRDFTEPPPVPEQSVPE